MPFTNGPLLHTTTFPVPTPVMITYLKRKYHRLTADKGFPEILHGTARVMAGRVGTTVLALVSSLMITRLYGAEAMGILALAATILSIASILL